MQQEVIDKTTNRIKELNEINTRFADLKIKYPQSIQEKNNRNKQQILAAKQKINHVFDILTQSIKQRRETLIAKVNAMEFKNDDNDENKEGDIFENVEDIISKEIESLNDNLKLFENTIKTKQNETKEKREESVKCIEEKQLNSFKSTKKKLKEHEVEIKDKIYKNKNDNSEIRYKDNQSLYTKLLKEIKNFGIITTTFSTLNPTDDDEELFEKEEFERKYGELQKQNELLLQKHNKFQLENMKLIKLEKEENNKYKELENKYNDIFQEKLKLEKEILNAIKNEYDTIDSITNALTFNNESYFRWFDDEKSNDLIIKTNNTETPKICVFKGGEGKIDYDEFVDKKPINSKNINDLSKCIVKLREHFEYFGCIPSWKKYDEFSSFYKGDNMILENNNNNNNNNYYVKSSINSYQSIFGIKTYSWYDKCIWKIKCHGPLTNDFYIGLIEKQLCSDDTKLLCCDYFCKSSISYAFSPYYGQLYNDDKWGQKYGKQNCGKDGDIINVYLQNGTLSFGVNDEKFAKIAYQLQENQYYRLALSFKGIYRSFEIVSSVKY